MACLALKRTNVVEPNLASPNATPSGYGPSDLSSAYALPSGAGGGQTVAIVDAQDDPNAESDLATYRSTYGLPACTTANGCFKKIAEDGSTNYPTGDTGWAGEISLDVDMVSAVCPNCHILLVEATSANMDDLGTAVNQAVSQGAKFVSNSYGGSEDSTDTSSDSSYFNHPGVAITVSSGDEAYGAEYPAASQYVTAVGGTSLSKASNSRGWSESVWSTSSTEGGGSGCSAYDAKPSWQKDTGCSKRTIADVSAVADPATGVAVYQTYGGSGWDVYGGTSASSPIIASVYALAGTPAAGSYPSSYPYAHTSNLNDVTTGNNGTCSPTYLCTAGPGYDGPTGLGTPAGTAAFASGTSTGNTVTVTNPGSQSGKAGTAVSLQLSGTDSASGQTLSYTATGLPAGLSISSSGLISGTPTTAGTSSVTVTAKDSTGATGSTTFSWTVSSATGNTVTVTSPGNQSGTVGTAVSLQVSGTDSASGQSLSYSATGLPAGLSISSSGLISGTPTTAGTSSVTVTAKDSTGATGSATFSWTVAAGTGCTGGGQLLGNAGFETGTASPWTASAGVIDNSSSEPAHSGSWKAWLDGYGTTHTDTLSQTVTIPAGCKATFSFWLHIDTAETGTTAYDKLAVTANGTNLATYSNVNANTGYVQKSFDLSSYAGKSVTLKFTGTEDSSLQTSFVIDDTALNAS
ncbi:putative Ig domain-containing protein [Kitasatospora sp. NBC_01287]|uniref:putative Ig domain-containing protein n=1 Tax=Kitasatospora sp. NBC_01287 TaxID=2903573 RepID=UPI002258B31C|nr:putative Ig domain-containing protein [Kitasatospora sp. NBC_01287]MCX4745436.1 putative Ig domain-containing protein [Kitasatospora sp. NBC_01287]